MSIQSFKANVWEGALITNFHNVSIADVITTAPSKIEGEKAIFNKVSGGAIKDYAGAITYDTLATAPIELNFDKKKYFAISLDDVDAVQANGEVLGVVAEEKALDMAEVADQELLQMIATNATNKITKSPMMFSEAYDLVVDLGVELSKKKVPNSNRFVVASAEFIQQMAKDDRFVDNFNVLPNGVLDGVNIAGMKIVQTENVPANHVIVLHKSAVGYATQLDKVEALRLEGSFSDAVRGLQVSGETILRDEAIVVAEYDLA